jgi:predicted Fe-Mo cluster-binding NifX family protein
MLYLVAAEDSSPDAAVSKRFGQAPHHLLVDSETRVVAPLPGRTGGTGRLLAAAARLKVDGIISGNIGPRAFQRAQGAGIPVYVLRGQAVLEAVEQVAGGKVEPVLEATLKQSPREGGGGEGGGRHAHRHEHHHNPSHPPGPGEGHGGHRGPHGGGPIRDEPGAS